MLLTLDIGNTNICAGIFLPDKSGRRYLSQPEKFWRLSTNPRASADEYGTKILDLFHYGLLDATSVKEIAIASVVPKLDMVFRTMAENYFHRKPFFLTTQTLKGLTLKVDNPKEVGADRLANALAAYTLFNKPTIIIDFGTATTFDVVSKKGEYLGGLIFPGPLLSIRALAENTAKLPEVNFVKPNLLIGKNTIAGIQSGIYFGYLGMLREIINRLKKEINNPLIVATGGSAVNFAGLKEIKKVIPELTLLGIKIALEKYSYPQVNNNL